jgi:hypothetical protein
MEGASLISANKAKAANKRNERFARRNEMLRALGAK